MAHEKTQRGAGADAPGNARRTKFSQPELGAATTTLERRRNQARRRALKIAYRVRRWLDREGQIAVDQIVRNQDPTSMLKDLIHLVQRDIHRLIDLEYHLVRLLPLTIRLQMLHSKILRELAFILGTSGEVEGG